MWTEREANGRYWQNASASPLDMLAGLTAGLSLACDLAIGTPWHSALAAKVDRVVPNSFNYGEIRKEITRLSDANGGKPIIPLGQIIRTRWKSEIYDGHFP
jgi:hypothetical protein